MKRWISILLCMTMLFTSVLGDISWALAETEEDALIQEVVSGNEEAEVGLATDAGDTGLTIEYEEEPGDSSDDYIIEIIEDETTEDSGSAADGDDGKTLSALSGFDFGYAKIISGADVYAESGAEAIALAKIGKGDVVLCIGRADKRAKITFNTEKGVVTGYVDDSILVKMSDDEINSFMNEAADYANVVLYENNLDYPISYLNCTFVDNSAQKQAGEQTEVSSGENEETADSEEAAKKDSVNTPSENENNIPADGETTETPTEDGAIEGETTETPTEGGATDGETTETPTEDGAIEGETTETPTEGDKIDGETTETPTEGEVIEGETTETPSEGGTTEGETTETPTEGEVTESETTETPSEGGATEGETTETPSEGKVTEGETTETPSEGGATEGETTETPTEGEETEGETTETPTEGEVTEGETTETPSEGEVTEGETTETPSEGEVTDGETTETPTEGDVTEGETTETPSEGGATEGETTETPTEGEETEGETTETPTEGDVIDGENADTSAEEGVEEETTEDTSNEEGSEELEVAEGLEEGIVEDMPVAMFSLRSPLALNETAVPVLTSLSRSAVSMAVGENFTLKAFDAEGNEIDEVVYALSSENTEEAILTLYGNEVVAEAVGTEIITATYNEISLTCEVSVFDAPQSIIVDKTDLKLHEGMKEKLNVSFDSENTASLIQFAYSGETEGVVSVDAQGNISALKAGSCKIIVSASTEGIAPVEVSITVYPGPTGIILSASEMTLGAGETAKLDIDTIDGIGKDDIFVFESSNSDAAAVDQNGMIEARAKGEATITVTASNGVYAQCKVNVLNAPTRIAFASDLAIGVGQNKAIPEMTLYAGETETSTGAIREIVSGNSEFVIVESDGTLTGVNVGTATVTVTAYNGATGSFKVTVMNPPSSIALEPAEAELSAGGQQLQLKPIFNSGSMGAVVYESSDIDVATVDENGLVTTWGYGYATITATVMGNLGEELKATSLIEVSNAPAQVMLSKKEVQLGVNFSEVLSASALDAQGVQVNAGYTYHIEQEGNIIAFDEATGKITGLGIGTAKIYVQTHNGVSQYKDEETGEMVDAVCSVEVRGTPKTLSLNISGGNIGYGETYTGLKATAYDENGKETKANLSVWSSKSSYVKAWYDAASGQIRIQGRKAGKSAYVYVRTHNGLQKAIKVNVKKAPSKCYVSPGSVTLAAEGQTCQLKVSVNSGTACATYAFASSNPNVVTVSGGGLLTAVNSGSATITIRTYNNRYAYCKVNVIAPPAEVYFPTEKMTIGVSQSSSVKAAVRAEDGSATQASYTFHTEDTDIISLNASTGAIKGLAKGEATITVKTHNGVYGYTAEDGEPVVATCTVKVVAAPAAVQLNLSGTKYIGLKEYFSGLKINLLGPVGEDGEREETAGTYSVAITKGSKYISINQSGHIYGKKTGSAQIRVSSYNGKHAYLNIKVVKAPKKVAMNASNVTLALGGSAEDGTIMTYQLGARVNSGAASGTFTFGYYNEAAKSVFEITPSGLITPKSVGTGYAVVRTYNGKAATCKVTVKPEPATVQLSAETLKLGVGQGATLKATAYDASGAATVAKFRFESSNPDAVYINPTTGAISAKAKTEEAIITVTAHNGAYGYEKDGAFVAAQCRVKVVAAPAAVQLNLSGTKTIGLKEYFSGLKITMLGPVGEDGEREETAGNYSVAITKGSKYISINQSGHIYGKKTGSAQIRVSSYNGKHAYLNIKVVKAPSKIALNASAVTLALGKYEGTDNPMTYQLGAWVNGGAASGGYTFTSNNTSVATVSGGGLITPVSAGTATITVSTYNNKRAYCKVTVLDEPAEVFLPETITTAEGLSGNISASVKDALGGNTTTKYTYSVVNGTDAEGKGSLTINPSTGAITGKVAGEAEIRVKAHNGVSTHLVDGSPVETVCKVKIVPAPKDLKLNTYGVTIGVGEKITIKGTMLAPDGTELTGSNLTFSRNNTRITVNGSGVVQGKKTGTAYVYVRTYNGITKTVKVVVKKAPKKVSITPGSATLGVGQTGQFRAKFASGYYGGHSFTSSNPNVATINAAGVVTAKAVGSTTITVRTYNGKAKSAKLTVRKGPEFMLLSGTGLNRVDVGDLVENEIIGQAGVFTGHLYEKLMKPGETFQIGVTNEKFTNGNVVSYESSDAAVASVNGSGKITALKNGVALIAVTSSSGAEEYILVTVDDPTVQLEFADESAEILVGEVKPVPALKGVDDPLYQMTLEYTGNLNLNVFMDDETGKWYMEGVSVGSGMLGVKTPHANGASIPVTVKAQHNGDVTVSTADEMAIGDTADISVSNVISGDYELESLNKSVAVVENGRLKAVGAGTTNVIATMLDGAEFYSNPVTVSAKPVSVKLDSQTATLKVNETMQLRPDVGEAYTTFSYASDNEAVATVDANGKITAIAPGAARITVNTAVPGIFTYCDITVKAAPGAPDTATLQTGAMLLFAGETGAIEVVFSRADGAECTAAELKYASDSEVVSISNDGVVSAVAAGIANITVSAILNGEEKEIGVCAVTVKETAQKLSVTPESLTLSIADAEGETLTISGLAEGETLTAEADKDIADISVSENIITVIPKAAGSAKLTITASNGNAVVCLLTIEALPVQPTGISVNKPDYKLGVGETFDIGAALIPAGSAGEIAYVSEDESVATVENGVISAVAPGSATIRVSCGEISGSIDVEVGYGVESVRLERDELNLLVGAEYLMTAPELMGESAKASGSYTWAISNPKVATIDAEGKITAKAEGTAILMVTAYNGVKGYMDIIVSAQPSEIRFADESICLAVGESYAPVVLSDAGALVDAVFSVEESVTCLAIEDNKLVGKEAGEAVVTATYGEGENALTAEIAVTVGDVAGKVSLNASEITLSVGEKFQLVAETDGVSATIDYASEDEYTASVNGNGLITARRAGQTIITATAFGGEYARCVVNVVSAPTELSVTPGEITASLAEGGAQLRWSFGSSDEGGKVYFDVTGEDEGANISAISVNEDGYITFNEVGWAYVTVKTHNGLTAVVPVTVTATPGSMNFEAADLVIVKGDTVLNPIVFPGNTSTNFELSDGEGIVSVQKSGASVAFTGLEVGKTTITATTAIGLTATCNVEVVDAVSGMTLSPASLSLYLGEQAKLAVSFEPENAKATVSFISQNELIATVDADGYVTGGAQGSTIIQAQLKIGENILQTASCEVTVTGPRRKMFIAHSYYDTAYGGEALYFSHNNARGMKNTFSKSSINGEEYEMKFMTNPSKNTLLGGLSSYFADSTENDINVIYLLSHGLPTADGYQYGLVLPGYVKYANNSPYYYISATELMATISQIKGKVVLILDSCYSGVFIDNMRSKLNAAGGRISVMTATSNINASYWLEKNVNKDVDFFTFALLQGLGYNCQNNVYGYGLAADSNGNGQVTLQELFNFTKSKTVSYVSSYYKSSKFRGNRYQVPQSYIGDNADLVLFDPK